MRKRPTILDVAAKAGLSKSTVSRVLSGSPNVTDDARRTVEAAARNVGYIRNHMAGGMRSGRSGLIGLLIPDIANPFWSDVARGAQDRAAERDLALLILSSDWNSESETRHVRTLEQVCVDGAIINPVSDSTTSFDNRHFPVVLIGSSADNFPDSAAVGSDIRQGVKLGMDYLVRMGHAVPRLIVGPTSRISRARFLTAVRDHCVARDLDPALLEIEDGTYTLEGGRAAMNRLLGRPRIGPICVFAANDLMALGAILAVRDAGLRCPQDVSILGFDGIAAGMFSWPGLTTVVKPTRAIGAAAVDRLMDQIDRPEAAPRSALPCILMERGSVSNLAARHRASGTTG